MKQFNPAVCLIVVFVLLIGCSKSSEEAESNGVICNSTNIKFSTDIVPLFQANCYACHSNANVAVSGISLEGYNNVKVKVNDGRLIGAITHAAGFSPMPQSAPKLSDCNINKIINWVNSGATNN